MLEFRDISDETLLVRAVAEPEAFGVFYERHVAAVLAYFRNRVSGPETALDLAGETFARALEALPSFEPEAAPGRAWLFAIARNLLIDAYRRGRVANEARRRLEMPRLALTDDDLDRVEAAAQAGQSDLLALVAGLPVDMREAIEARVIKEQPYEEIARDVECSESVVRKRVSRGLELLRNNMDRGMDR